MTATPKETKYVSNIHYFGDPVYTYSLKQGIGDGFLAPYKVVKVHIDRGRRGLAAREGQARREGEEIEDRIYNQKDFDRTLVIDERTKLVAQQGHRVPEGERRPVPEDHRLLRGQGARRADAAGAGQRERGPRATQNQRYVMRITGNDNEGQAPARQLHRPGVEVSR